MPTGPRETRPDDRLRIEFQMLHCASAISRFPDAQLHIRRGSRSLSSGAHSRDSVASLNDAEHAFAFSRLMVPELVRNLTLGINRGRRECRATDAPMAPCAIKSTGVGTTGTPDQPAFPAQWFYGLYVLSSVTIAWLPPSSARCVSIIADLAPASERQNHTTSPSAGCIIVVALSRSSTRHPVSMLATTQANPHLPASPQSPLLQQRLASRLFGG
jgi:hypothetical protein